MKYVRIIILTGLLFSCSDEKQSDCYKCVITYILTTDVPVSGYPTTTSTDYDLCDITAEQAEYFEETNKGTESTVIGNITYTSKFSTVCTHN